MKTCTRCKESKQVIEFRYSRSVCKQCERARVKEWYHKNKNITPKACKVCLKVSTNFQKGKAQCRTCLARKRRDYNISQRTGLSIGMIALWKAGYAYEDAVKVIKNNRVHK